MSDVQQLQESVRSLSNRLENLVSTGLFSVIDPRKRVDRKDAAHALMQSTLDFLKQFNTESN